MQGVPLDGVLSSEDFHDPGMRLGSLHSPAGTLAPRGHLWPGAPELCVRLPTQRRLSALVWSPFSSAEAPSLRQL